MSLDPDNPLARNGWLAAHAYPGLAAGRGDEVGSEPETMASPAWLQWLAWAALCAGLAVVVMAILG